MIYAGSAGARRPALRRARRGPLPPGRLPGPGVGGGDHPPAGRTCALVCLSATVSNAEELAEWMTTVRGPTAAVIEERRPVELRNLYLVGDRESRATPPAADAGRRAAQPRGRPARQRHLARRAPRRANRRPRRRFFTPRRPEVVELLGERRHAAGDLLHLQPRGLRRGRRGLPRRRAAAHRRRTSGRGSARSSRSATAALDRRRPRRARLRPVAGRRSRRARRPPRGHGPAVQGGGRGLLRRGSGQGGVRHRDARARHQHAGAVGGDREAHQVHRRAPRVPHAGGVHAAHGPGRAAGHRRPRLRRRAVVARSCPSTRWRRWRRSRTLRAASRPSGRPTTWRPTWCGGTSRPTAHHLLNLSFAQFQADREVVRFEARSSASRSGSPRLDADATCERGDVEEYRRLARAAQESTAPRPEMQGAVEFALSRIVPGDVVDVGGQRLAVLSIAYRKGGSIRLRGLDANGEPVLVPSEDDVASPRAGWGAWSCRAPTSPTTGRSSTGWPTRCAGRGSTGPRAARRSRSRVRPAVAPDAALGRPPGPRLPGPRPPRAGLRSSGSGPGGGSTTCGARSGARRDRWRGGSTGCCGCSRRGATSTAGR